MVARGRALVRGCALVIGQGITYACRELEKVERRVR